MTEMDDFLRQMAARRGHAKGLAGAAPAPPTPQPAGPAHQLAEAEIVYEAEPVDAPMLEPLSSSDLQEVAAAHPIETHMHEVFDHPVGDIPEMDALPDMDSVHDGQTPVDIESAGLQDTRSARDSLVAMLRDPAQLRQAILLSEIMNPPSHRW